MTIQPTQTYKANSPSNILKAEFTDHITRVLNPRNETPPIPIYCDASVNPAGAAGIGVLIPSLGQEASIRLADWTSITDAETIAIYHALQMGSDLHASLAIFSDSQGALYRLKAFNPTDLASGNIHQIVLRLSRRNIQVSFYWVPSHIGISQCDKVDRLAKKALMLEEPAYGLPLSMQQLKKRISLALQDAEDQAWIQEELDGSSSIKHYEQVACMSSRHRRYKLYERMSRR